MISIIIPSCNENALIDCLEYIIRNTKMEHWDVEVIVVLNGVTGKSKELVASFGPRFKYLWFDNRVGICKASNAGFAVSKGEYIIRMDDDAYMIGNNWLELMISPFLSDPNVGQTGIILQTHPSRGNRQAFIGCLIMTKRSIWEEVGGFDEIFDPGMGEDSDFSFKIADRGYKLVTAGGSSGIDPIFKKEKRAFEIQFPIFHKSWGTCGTPGTAERNNRILDERYGK